MPVYFLCELWGISGDRATKRQMANTGTQQQQGAECMYRVQSADGNAHAHIRGSRTQTHFRCHMHMTKQVALHSASQKIPENCREDTDVQCVHKEASEVAAPEEVMTLHTRRWELLSCLNLLPALFSDLPQPLLFAPPALWVFLCWNFFNFLNGKVTTGSSNLHSHLSYDPPMSKIPTPYMACPGFSTKFSRS